MLLYIIYYIVQRCFGLVGDTWHGIKRRRMSESFFGETKYHYRSGSSVVDNDFARIRHQRLAKVYIQRIQPPGFENLVDYRFLFFILDVALAAGKLCQGVFGNIVLGGTETAG